MSAQPDRRADMWVPGDEGSTMGTRPGPSSLTLPGSGKQPCGSAAVSGG